MKKANQKDSNTSLAKDLVLAQCDTHPNTTCSPFTHAPLHIPEPLSMTRAAISSSSDMVVVWCWVKVVVGGGEGTRTVDCVPILARCFAVGTVVIAPVIAFLAARRCNQRPKPAIEIFKESHQGEEAGRERLSSLLLRRIYRKHMLQRCGQSRHAESCICARGNDFGLEKTS